MAVYQDKHQIFVSSVTAHSPQAKGRIERHFGTFQDRLISEFDLYQIITQVVAGSNPVSRSS